MKHCGSISGSFPNAVISYVVRGRNGKGDDMASILCIEDEVHLRELIAEDLQASGHQIYEARDGVEGMQIVLRHKPDLVVSDITMPRMDGIEFVKKVRSEHPDLADMPVIFLTALTDRSDMLDGIKNGADDYLTKPIDFELLELKVQSALRQSARMIEKKNQEQVKLYNALTTLHEEPESETLASCKLKKHRFVLVGESHPELWTVKDRLDQLGQQVRVFTSGRSFLQKAGECAADVVLLWLQSDDMQGPMIATMNKSHDNLCVLVLPESVRGKQAANATMNGVDEIVALPLSDDAFVGKVKEWIAD